MPEGMNTAQTLPHSGLLDRDADSISTIQSRPGASQFNTSAGNQAPETLPQVAVDICHA